MILYNFFKLVIATLAIIFIVIMHNYLVLCVMSPYMSHVLFIRGQMSGNISGHISGDSCQCQGQLECQILVFMHGHVNTGAQVCKFIQ